MSGSYRHCLEEDGSFTFDFIENLGDAREACEQMVYMIRWLARGDGDRIKAAEDAYYTVSDAGKEVGTGIYHRFQNQVEVKGYRGRDFQEIRLVLGGGGPGGLEAIVKVDEDMAALVIWNPYKHPPEAKGEESAWHRIEVPVFEGLEE